MQHYGEEVPHEFLMHRLILLLSYHAVLSDSQFLFHTLQGVIFFIEYTRHLQFTQQDSSCLFSHIPS